MIGHNKVLLVPNIVAPNSKNKVICDVKLKGAVKYMPGGIRSVLFGNDLIIESIALLKLSVSKV